MTNTLLQFLPIVISIFALLVSAGALAYQFYVSDHVVCVVTRFMGKQTAEGGTSASLSLSISNAGTRTIMLEGVQLMEALNKER
jgi:hypothetical protein